MSKVIRSIIALISNICGLNNPTDTDNNIAQLIGLSVSNSDLTIKLSWNFFKILDMSITSIKDGIISDSVASPEPNIPEVFKPAYVATFIPTGPGVTDAIAIICLSSCSVYQP